MADFFVGIVISEAIKAAVWVPFLIYAIQRGFKRGAR